MVNYLGTKLVGVAYKVRKKMKSLPPCVHVLHKTLNVGISSCCFAEDGKEMYQNVKRTCRAIFFHIKLIVSNRERARYGNVLFYLKLDHCVIQFQRCDWLSGHVI